MPKLDLNFQLLSVSGKPIEGTTAGKVLANAISQSNKGNAIKLWDWALKFFNDEPVTVDNSDLDLLTGMVEDSQILSVLSKAQILKAIKSLRLEA